MTIESKSVSDFVAATMDAVLKSQEHQSLFGTQYKFASDDENDAKKRKFLITLSVNFTGNTIKKTPF